MRTKKLGLGFLVAAVIAAAAAAASVVGGSPESSSPEAYVTLLYGDEFLLGVRVLGKSIRDTGSNKDMVVLASDGVSDFAKKLLQVNCFASSFNQTLVFLHSSAILDGCQVLI